MDHLQRTTVMDESTPEERDHYQRWSLGTTLSESIPLVYLRAHFGVLDQTQGFCSCAKNLKASSFTEVLGPDKKLLLSTLANIKS